MKIKVAFKRAIFAAGLAVVLSGCSLSKEVRNQRNMISGSWVLEDISFKGASGTFKAVLFNDVEDICLEGSDWFFRDNNSTGRYTIAPSSLCDAGDRSIRWSVVSPTENYKDQLQFKFIDGKGKDIDAGIGYRLTIDTLTEQNMTLNSTVQADGAPVTVVYSFARKQSSL